MDNQPSHPTALASNLQVGHVLFTLIPYFLTHRGDTRSGSSGTERAEPEGGAGEGNASDTLMFDTRESGQLTVKRLDAAEKPLLQLSMPLNDPVDPLPDNMTPDSPLVKVNLRVHLVAPAQGLVCLSVLGLGGGGVSGGRLLSFWMDHPTHLCAWRFGQLMVCQSCSSRRTSIVMQCTYATMS